MIEGHFVVLEGIDGAGTTTQVQRLAASMRARGLPVHTTREPSDGPIGTMIRQVLTGRLVVPGPAGGHALGWATMALLFAADRMDHLQAEVLPNVMEGVTVVSDRYDHSSAAYQSATSNDAASVAWIRQLNQRARRPDLTVVLDVDPRVAYERRQQRAGFREIYDDDELQQKLASFYATVEQWFPDERIVHVNGNHDADTVQRDVLAAVEALRRAG